MSKLHHDINDNEIRIISHKNIADPVKNTKSSNKRNAIVASTLIAVTAVIAGILFLCHPDNSASIEEVLTVNYDTESASVKETGLNLNKGYVLISDTIINCNSLSIFTPVNATPRLHVGTDILNDTSVLMAVWAADLRADNGMIVGAFVEKGELVSKGEAKAGFCAIIDNKMTIGVADATPMLEQALEYNGYFFRQYPLVVGNQVVENKPKGKALRKALAEIDGRHVVVMSRNRMTFHDFSQTLVDLGVTNAIYLVGSSTYCFAINEAGQKIEFGLECPTPHSHINYLVWE